MAISIDIDWGYKRHLEVYAGCHSYADQAGWDCSINPVIDRVLASRQGGKSYDGVIARATRSLARAARQAGVPLVNVWRNSPVQDLPGVFPDSEAAGAMAAEHLLSRGLRSFAYLGFQNDVDSRMQLRGFSEVTRREGFRTRLHRVALTSLSGKASDWQKFIAGLRSWVDSWKLPIGVFVTQDLVCRYLIDVCRSKGLHVSQDVAIVGAGNEIAICSAPPPAITSIDLAYGRIGYQAAALLEHLMDGVEPPSTPLLVAPAELVPRQTTDSYASDDPVVVRALRFIAENSHRPVQVKHVAATLATTRRTLERRFRQSIGRSIAATITRLRLERAKRQLVETNASMQTVAWDSGFSTADHFYKVFARVEGIPPSQYREERQQIFPVREL